jgi:predicted N-acetyltransferase YhbS
LNVRYSIEPELTVAEFVDVLTRSTLAERRPVDDLATIAGMLANADIIVAARDDAGVLVGISRAITDYNYCTYLSDLAVDRACQRQGIGRELIRRTHEAAGLKTRLILLAGSRGRLTLLGGLLRLNCLGKLVRSGEFRRSLGACSRAVVQCSLSV